MVHVRNDQPSHGRGAATYALFRDLGGWDDRLPKVRHVLEKRTSWPANLATVNLLLGARGLMLRSGTVVDATLISAPGSTKNASGNWTGDAPKAEGPAVVSSA